MRVFLTGAAGFVGSHVARLLVQNGHEVQALIRPGSRMERISDILPLLRVISIDLADAPALDAALEACRPELCLHFAWHLTPGGDQTGQGNVESLTASLHLASRLATLGCRKMVVAGSCFEYDADGGYFSETSAVKPTSLYEATKLGLLYVLEQLCAATGMELVWLRLFPLYGPAEDPRRLVPAVILSLLRGQEAEVTAGGQVRDYLHVADAAAAVWAITQSALTGIVNIGSGRPVFVADVVKIVAALLEREDLLRLGARPYRAGEPMFLCADNRRLLENTGWRPRFPLEEGLRQTVSWWRGQEALSSDDVLR